MYEWNETEQAIQDAVRQFVDAEIRPRCEEFEFGDSPPYDVLRKLWKTFGIDTMASDSLEKMLAKERAGKLPTLAEASAMKVYSSQAATDVAMDAVQLFGGNGYMSEYPLEQLARDAKSLMIYAGSNEVQITHVAKGLLT